MRSRPRLVIPCMILTAPFVLDAAIARGIVAGSASPSAAVPVTAKETQAWDFEADEPGGPAKGITGEVGRWVVEQDGKGRVLAQKAANDDDTFNVALAEGTSSKDVDLSVRLKAMAGKNDQGGGLVWRARDAKNYYIARYNPLEDNLRVYKVEGGKRTMFEHAKVAGDLEWHTLRVTMNGPRMTCYFDGKKSLEAEDSTFTAAGRIGLWSKADAQTHFDDLRLGE